MSSLDARYMRLAVSAKFDFCASHFGIAINKFENLQIADDSINYLDVLLPDDTLTIF